MMKLFVQQELEEQISKNYPHMRYPPCICAKVVSVQETSGTYMATLKIIDKKRQKDTRFPEIPRVSTQIPISKGDVVVILLLYWELDPYIVGRCD